MPANITGFPSCAWDYFLVDKWDASSQQPPQEQARSLAQQFLSLSDAGRVPYYDVICKRTNAGAGVPPPTADPRIPAVPIQTIQTVQERRISKNPVAIRTYYRPDSSFDRLRALVSEHHRDLGDGFMTCQLFDDENLYKDITPEDFILRVPHVLESYSYAGRNIAILDPLDDDENSPAYFYTVERFSLVVYDKIAQEEGWVLVVSFDRRGRRVHEVRFRAADLGSQVFIRREQLCSGMHEIMRDNEGVYREGSGEDGWTSGMAQGGGGYW